MSLKTKKIFSHSNFYFGGTIHDTYCCIFVLRYIVAHPYFTIEVIGVRQLFGYQHSSKYLP